MRFVLARMRLSQHPGGNAFDVNPGDLGGATAEYERIIGRNSKDKRTRTMLKQLYGRLGRTEQLLALEAPEK